MKQNYVNLEVFNKRDGTIGTIISQNGTTLSIKAGSIIKEVTESSFLRWYTIVPQDSPVDKETNKESKTTVMPETPDQGCEENTTEKKTEEGVVKKDNRTFSSGEQGIGDKLRDRFLTLVKEQANQNLDISYNEKSKQDIIKYNGRNVFECTTAKRRFNVMCHPDSLTHDNLKRAEKVFPKEWGWSLRAKFVFTDVGQWLTMKTIIVDGLFYRQREESKDVKQHSK